MQGLGVSPRAYAATNSSTMRPNAADSSSA
jgi:hypothetical protein